MARSTDHAKKAEKLQAEVKTLKAKVAQFTKESKANAKQWKEKLAEGVELAYNRGYAQARLDQDKLDDAFDKFMEKAARQFEKEYLAKMKKTAAKKPARKAGTKAQPKAKATTAKKRGRPAAAKKAEA